MMSKQFDFKILERCHKDALNSSATIRQQVDYFQVAEQLPFEPDGSGGHVFLFIEKRGCNTDWVAQQLAKFAGVPEVAIGYAGLKDRHALTRQWFSINTQGIAEPDWQQFETEEMRILRCERHGKKLKRGVLSGNHFTIRLTDITGDHNQLIKRLDAISVDGVPNYFAEQRFGHNMNNLHQADRWFNDGRSPRKRHQRSLYLSAARSWLFNLLLSHRVADGTWSIPMSGDVMQLAGTRASYFVADIIDETLVERLAHHDIHLTGPLYGKGNSLAVAECLALEQDLVVDWQDWLSGLQKAGLHQERRALRVIPNQCRWQFIAEDTLEVSFFLPAGSYATAVLRELVEISDAAQRNSLNETAFSVLEAGSGQ